MPTIKLVVIGASGVGKTSLRGKYVNGRFSNGYRATIGADFITKTLENPLQNHNSESVTLQIWDTAGQERFSSLSTAFFRGADACILMFDVNKPETLLSLLKWWQEFCNRAPVADEELQDYCVVVVGNKTDLADETLAKGGSVVSKQEAEEFLDELVPPLSPAIVLPSAREEDERQPNHLRPPNEQVEFPSSSPPRSASIAIQSPPHQPPLATRRAPAISLSPSTRNGRSRSSTRFNSGTIASIASGFSIYHTPSSSLFSDSWHSARSSPTNSRPASPYSGRSSPSLTRLRTPTLSTSTLATLTPSLYNARRREETELTQQPHRGPRLFLTSAKTGDGVSDVFEYIAERVVRRVEWEERRMAFEDSSPSFVRLGALGRRGLQITSSHDSKTKGRCC